MRSVGGRAAPGSPSARPAPSRMVVLGRYIITPAIFDILAHTLPGKGNEVQLTDALQVLVHRQPVYAVLRHGRSHQERPRARKGRAEEVRGVWPEKTDGISQGALQLL